MAQLNPSTRLIRPVLTCFRHCQGFVYCCELPDLCPMCHQDILKSEMAVPPFEIKSPFSFPTKSIPALWIKPSGGRSFLDDYTEGDCLHCGLSDENGVIHDFDEGGLHTCNMERWHDAICVALHNTSFTTPLKDRIEVIKLAWTETQPREQDTSQEDSTV